MKNIFLLLLFVFSVNCVQAYVPAYTSHSHKLSYSDNWVCDRGFKEVKSSCQKIIIPKNAKLDYSGSSWRCKRGYAQVNNECKWIVPPEHAYVVGNEWKCHLGYKKKKNKCVERTREDLLASLQTYRQYAAYCISKKFSKSSCVDECEDTFGYYEISKCKKLCDKLS